MTLSTAVYGQIFVIQRGGCPFVTKVNYAQMMGAKMVIIVDNVEEEEQDVIMYGKFILGKMMGLLISCIYRRSSFQKYKGSYFLLQR
jgi:hypothetical protein